MLAAHDATAAQWNSLREDLTRWLRTHVGEDLDPANLAGDAMLAAMDCFGIEPATPRPVVWCWMRQVAQNEARRLLRATNGRRTERSDLDAVAASAASDAETWATALLVALRVRAPRAQRAVLQQLEDGVSRNKEIARQLGLGERAIERVRQRLRALAKNLLRTRRSCSGASISLCG